MMTYIVVFQVCHPFHAAAISSSCATNQEELDQLKDIFRRKSTNFPKFPLWIDADEEDNDSLLEPVFYSAKEKADFLNEVLRELLRGFSTQKEKLKGDEEDVLNDALVYYKDPYFDPTKRLRIVYTGQPAVDKDGVSRHFFSQLLQVISEMFFQGTNYKSPIYNADTVASDVMKYIGIIIVHSILFGGPGFPVFSPSVYRYIATGDVNAAMVMLNY